MIVKIKEIQDFIKKNNWVFAKTYAKSFPHEYVVKNDDNKKDFEAFVKFIQTKGEVRKFFKEDFRYYFIDGYKYWTMGSAPEKTIIINREEMVK